jgi:D-alanine-D-alanine ligase
MADRFGKVAVLMGGISAEREVSLKSGDAVLRGLQSAGVYAHGIDAGHDVLVALQQENFERVFIALHGRWGEDGVIQGALEVIGLPYTGSGVLASALAMDKLRSKRLWLGMGISTPDFIECRPGDDITADVNCLDLPLFIKPSHEGSSVGMTKVTSEDQLKDALKLAQQYDGEVLIEQFIDGAEYTVAILRDKCLPVIRVETPRDFYDYKAKYEVDSTLYHCPSGLEAETEKHLQKVALEAYQALGCSGWGRVDLMMDNNGVAYVLEVNTVPGMTDHSLVPMAAKQAGLTFSELTVSVLETSDGA